MQLTTYIKIEKKTQRETPGRFMYMSNIHHKAGPLLARDTHRLVLSQGRVLNALSCK